MSQTVDQSLVTKCPINQDYAWILEKFHLTYNDDGLYYKVGQLEKIQGWELHLSCKWTHIQELLNTVLPLLVENHTPFKVVKDDDKARMISNSSLQYDHFGKVLCIYPANDMIAVTLAKSMIPKTNVFRGCDIPTDFHLGGIIYTRYGSFGRSQIGDVKPSNQTNGIVIQDEYTIPYKFPKGISWPFSEIKTAKVQAPATFLNNNYYIISTLKNDTKGRVMKALRIKGLKIQTIVIKEAKHDVCVDQSERDIRERLLWQYMILKDLQGKISLPKVYDFFKENENSYLVMEFIKGKHLNETIAGIYKSSIWTKLDLDRKLLLIDYLLQLINTIKSLHEQGFIHRDINPVNFILNQENKLTAIDLELTYSMNNKFPEPPFSLGTFGFMSPEQLQNKKPEPNQDIYSLGAIMICFFTNLSPLRFDSDRSGLPDQLYFFIPDKKITQLISTCLYSAPAKRPDIDKIKFTIETFREELLVSNP